MDAALYIRALLALVFVIGLMLVMLWVVRRFNIVIGGSLPVLARSKVRRLAVLETLPLDARRRLVLVRRDGMEHLILLGATSEIVVEAGVHSNLSLLAEMERRDQTGAP
jgi:flagellar protein FliO/FliZ